MSVPNCLISFSSRTQNVSPGKSSLWTSLGSTSKGAQLIAGETVETGVVGIQFGKDLGTAIIQVEGFAVLTHILWGSYIIARHSHDHNSHPSHQNRLTVNANPQFPQVPRHILPPYLTVCLQAQDGLQSEDSIVFFFVPIRR